MSSLGYEESKPTPRQAAYQGPCLMWLRTQQSGYSEDEEVQAVTFERQNMDVEVPPSPLPSPSRTQLLEQHMETVEIRRKKHVLGEVVVSIGSRGETTLSGRAVLHWTASETPRLVFPHDGGFTLSLPSQQAHLALLLPELCSLFTEAGVQHNLHKWGALDEAMPHQPERQQEVCTVRLIEDSHKTHNTV